MLIDDMLPVFHFRETHSTSIRADPSAILDCASRLKAQDDPYIRFAITLRELPSRLLGRASRPPLDLDAFTFLGREADSDMALGLIGAFWQADYGLLDIRSADAFKTNQQTDVCRLVVAFNAEQRSSGLVLLTTETRVFCPTAEVRRRFAPYWYLIRPVSGLIRRRMLTRIRQQAERIAKNESRPS